MESGSVEEVSGLPLQATPLTAVWISLQNAGSHGNLSLIHKSSTPIQSNLILPQDQAVQNPPPVSTHPLLMSHHTPTSLRVLLDI